MAEFKLFKVVHYLNEGAQCITHDMLCWTVSARGKRHSKTTGGSFIETTSTLNWQIPNPLAKKVLIKCSVNYSSW